MADIKKTYQWLDKAVPGNRIRALIMAAEEQVLNTRWIEVCVYHTRQDPRYRLCKDAAHNSWMQDGGR